ncbi:TetR family transcriptional regulator [Paenibacillus psychroresistens]|uniref:TetR family transcriptional regulator n=1 Tax=Paenibacillus psychroresistens TaxID=1778678 RepID=A0A6B8RHM5_9BACL|nr:TetR family transcriptional regulator [Paenibacillus psychroresistens]QGQ95234.1 TetR family transcriptional regulator [Paenibacillus psychroresistens]
MVVDKQQKLGLRERKKIKTRAAIQRHALLLFRKQGYNTTTIEQIAEAAEISASTFFRYFPTKEAVVIEDDFDPLLIQLFKQQPASLTPLQAMHKSMVTGISMIPKEAHSELRERLELTRSVPELHAALLSQMANTMHLIAGLIADRIGADPHDFQVLTMAGSIIGVMMAVQGYLVFNPDADFAELVDQAMIHLEAGLPMK